MTQGVINNGETGSSVRSKLNDNYTELYSRYYLNVVDYGAVGDGITDDTAAFKACIAAASDAASCHRVFVPAGSYLMSETLLINDHLIIEGEVGFHYSGGHYPSVLIWPSACCGIVFHHDDTTCDANGYNHTTKVAVPRGDGTNVKSAGSLLKNLFLRVGTGSSTPAADGITHGVIIKSSVVSGLTELT
jgi:polygalacturonase